MVEKIAGVQKMNDRVTWLKGGPARCSHLPIPQAQPHRLILLGAPGVGKGTQAELLATALGACHLSTGDVFRSVKNSAEGERSPAMAAALECMKRGELVTDATVLALVADRSACLSCGGGFLLDGFPRTVTQALALEEILKEHGIEIEAVVDYRLPLKKIIERLSGRLTCSQCKAAYHIESLPPKMEGVCDHCGGKLFQREDDRPEAIRVRMEVYNQNAKPLKQFYRRRKLLVAVQAAGTPEETFQRTMEAIKRGQIVNPEPGVVCK